MRILQSPASSSFCRSDVFSDFPQTNYTDTDVLQIDTLFYRQQLPIPASKRVSAGQFSTDKAVWRKCVFPTVGKCLRSRQTKTIRDELRPAGYGVKLKLSYGASRRRRRRRPRGIRKGMN
jgi:hypothetical protein